MGDVTSHHLANQAEASPFGRSLNTSLCEIYDHKTAFLLVKTVLHKNFNLHIMCVGSTKGTFRRDIKMIVNHDYIEQCIILQKIFLVDYGSKYWFTFH